MNRRSLPIAAALTATAALMLTACGGSDEKPKANDKIAGVDQGATKPTTPSAAASDPAERPKIELPKDVKNVFESWKTGDPAKDAALADATQTVNAVDDAILRGDINSPALAFYRQGEALISGTKWVQAWLDEDLTFTGVTRYFNPEISLFDKKTAAVVYCADESKAYNKNRKSGEVDKSPSDESPYVLYNTRLQKSERGVWQTTNVLSKRGHKSCTS
ncbi:hypothetical protein [Streptomyces sp. NPDC001820]|uniref:hypothetical protein n=1 Tax=Streptomyces sp. NPDC001820 TaxID=3364613 RepID=UPI00369034B2